MSGDMPGRRGFVAGQSGVVSSVLRCPFLMCMLQVTPFRMHAVPSQAKPSLAKPREVKSRQAKVLTGGGDLREAQVDVPLSVNHSCV